jgi:lysophospholipase L1-like esterase
MNLDSNLQNKRTIDRLFSKGFNFTFLFLIFTITVMDIQMFGQQITLDREVRMLALGDSYTIGESVDINQRWPHQFIAELRKMGKDADLPDYIATTGWTTKDLLTGIASSLNREKDYNLVSILIGVNNQYQGMAIADYEPDLRDIIDLAIKIAGQDTTRVFMLSIPDYAYTPFGKGDKKISNEIDAYNEINRRVATEYGIARIDITPISRRGLIEPGLVAGDGLHPSGEQYREWVEKIIHTLE